MRVFILFLLSFFCSNLIAYPKVSEELAQKVLSSEISALISVSEKLFKKKVEYVEYIYHDSPPVGDAAAIIRFLPEKKSSTLYVFPTVFFYYLPWSADNPLPLEKKKIIQGNWASDGKLQNKEKYRFILANGTYYINFEHGVSYEEGLQLLKAIELDNYDINFETTGSPEWDKELKSISTKELQKLQQELKVDFIFHLRTGDILEYISKTKSKTDEYRITVDINNPKKGFSMWTFSKKGNKYILVAMAHYFI